MAVDTGKGTYVYIKEQPGLGVLPGDTGAVELARTTFTMDEKASTYRPKNKVRHGMKGAPRFGSQRVDAQLVADLAPGDHKIPIQALMRKDFAAGATTTGVTTIAAVTSGANKFTISGGGSWLTLGFKVGSVVRASGFASPATANNGKNLIVLSVTAGDLVVDKPLVAKAAGDTVTIAEVGKRVYHPTTGHLDKYYGIERFSSILESSELGCDMKFGGASIAIPSGDVASMTCPLLGRYVETDGDQYFTSPTAAGDNDPVAGPTGLIILGGEVVEVLTGMNINLANDVAPSGEYIGSLLPRDIIAGLLGVTGSLTASRENNVLRDLWRAKEAFGLSIMLPTSEADDADFLAIIMSRCFFTDFTRDDPDGALLQTGPFEAAPNFDGGTGTAHDKSSISFQDSTL